MASRSPSDAASLIIMAHLQNNNLIRDRRFRLRKYKQCIEAKETIASLVKHNLCQTRALAVQAMRRCVEAGKLAHVTHAHHFQDKYLFFNLTNTNNDDNTKDSLLLAEAKEMEGAKHGPSDVRSLDPVTQQYETLSNRYLVFVPSTSTLYEYPSDHAARPVLSLSLAKCSYSGAVSYCGRLKPGTYGIALRVPDCEESCLEGDELMNATHQPTAEQLGAAIDALNSNEGETKGGPSGKEIKKVKEVKEESSTTTDTETETDELVLLFHSVKEQESWLGTFVKAGMSFEETSSPNADMAKHASSIYDFSVSSVLPEKILSLNELLKGSKATILVNVASF